MSAREVLLAATIARLRGTAGLAGAGVFDAPPVRAALPYVQVEEPLLADWSTKSWAGREGRLTVLVLDGGERPVRLRTLAGGGRGGGAGDARRPRRRLAPRHRHPRAQPADARQCRPLDGGS